MRITLSASGTPQEVMDTITQQVRDQVHDRIGRVSMTAVRHRGDVCNALLNYIASEIHDAGDSATVEATLSIDITRPTVGYVWPAAVT